jgi:hypothetical protein
MSMKVQLTIFQVQDEFAEKTDIRYVAHLNYEPVPIATVKEEKWITTNSVNALYRRLMFPAVGEWAAIERALLSHGGFQGEYIFDDLTAQKLITNWNAE